MVLFKTLLAALSVSLVATFAAAQSDYQIRRGDTLQIEVFEDSDLNRSVVVLSDARISFPFAGTLRVAGRTVNEVQAALTSAISSNFAAPPTVFVAVQPAPVVPRPVIAPAPPPPPPTIDIYFLGEVSSPGAKAVPPGTTFLQAMAQSGGLTRFAAVKRVQLRRTDPKSRADRIINLNYDAIESGAAAGRTTLMDGDVIVVPQRRLFE